MAFTLTHGRIIVAIIAMLTLSTLLIVCSLPPDQCEVKMSWILVLISIVGTALGLEQLVLFDPQRRDDD